MLKDAKIYSKVVNDIENVIYNELRMRGYKVDVGVVPISEKDEDGKSVRKQLEVDFICNLGSKTRGRFCRTV